MVLTVTSLQNTPDSSLLSESTHTSSDADIRDIIVLSLSVKSGAKLVTFLAIYIYYMIGSSSSSDGSTTTSIIAEYDIGKLLDTYMTLVNSWILI